MGGGVERKRREDQEGEKQESTWSNWLGYIGKRSWEKGSEASGMEGFKVGGMGCRSVEESRELPCVLSESGIQHAVGFANRHASSFGTLQYCCPLKTESKQWVLLLCSQREDTK